MTIDRRARFREYMRRLDPTADPAEAVASGFYVQPPNAVSQRIATRIELEPKSAHMLVGGIGSGKTTELIVIEHQLATVEDLAPVRVDVPSHHRLEKLKPGVLIALAAAAACEELEREENGEGLTVEKAVKSAVSGIAKLTRGRWVRHDDFDDAPYDTGERWVKGILEAPETPEDVTDLSDMLGEVNGALQRRLVLLCDGLDRVTNLETLAAMLGQDIPAMARAGVGVVVVGPQHLRFSTQRYVEGVFETVHLHGSVGADTQAGLDFLTAVLCARADKDVLPEESAAAVARWSGGVLRDLVALGRAAGAEAYATGSDSIQESHVDAAADRFGRDLLLGCTKEMTARLKDLAPAKRSGHLPRAGGAPAPTAFTVATELDQKLLSSRLVIEIPGTPVRYILHPTVKPLVAGLGGA